MKSRQGSAFGRLFRKALYFSAGVVVAMLIAYVLYLNSGPDLHLWHEVELDEEFTVDSGVETFDEYLALEERLFKQLDELVYAEIPPEQKRPINRYNRGSLTDPATWSPNWNRSFLLPAESPRAGVLLLHGMSDSPYSLRALGERLQQEGMNVLGLRMPGHGTVPSGLVELTRQDMTKAVRLAMRHLEKIKEGRPIYLVGYSTGAALAMLYSLSMLEDETLPPIERIVLISPAIGIKPVAALAVWQGRLGWLLGLEKLAWTDILPEYDPFKYGSFAVNAGDVIYQMTIEIRDRITELDKQGKLDSVPPILAFSSIVDATVSTPDLIKGLFDRLPAGKHELVLFDINRMAAIEPIMNWDPSKVVDALQANRSSHVYLSLVTNRDKQSRAVIVRSQETEKSLPTDVELNLSWPDDIYSLAHVALPFSPADPLYGGHPAGKGNGGLQLGKLALRGERGVLQVPASSMLRLRWNPFYSYVEQRIIDYFELQE